MPSPHQEVIERLRQTLDARDVPQQPWSAYGSNLHRRARARRVRSITAYATAITVVVAAVAVGIALTGPHGSSDSNQRIVEITRPAAVKYAVVAHAQVGQQGSDPQIVVGNGSVFVDDWTHGRILRLDAVTFKRTGDLSVGHPQDSVLSLAYGAGAVWALDFASSSLLRIDPTSMAVLNTTPLEGQPSDVVYGGGYVWVTTVGRSNDPRTRQLLQRVNPKNGSVTGSTVIPGNGQSEQIAVGDAVAVSGETGPIQIVDPGTMKIIRTMTDPGNHPAGIASLNGQIYALGNNSSVRLQTTSGREPAVFVEQGLAEHTISLDQGMSAAAGRLWVTAVDEILGIDPSLGTVTADGQLPSAGQVASGNSPTGSIIVDVPNGIDRLQPASSRN